MATKPIEDLICRDFPLDIKNTLDQFAAVIEEAVIFGSHVFGWCVNSVERGDHFLPVFMSFRHILELTDAIAALIKESCVDPCKILLRSIFESLLSVEYILENNTEQRGKDFLIWHRHHTLKIYRRHYPKDKAYEKFSELISKDKLLKDMKKLEIPDLEERIINLERLLVHPDFIESEKEYQRIEIEKKRVRYWFNMHSGPNDIYDLALHLKRPAQYETIYKLSSAAAHGTDIIGGKVSRSETGSEFAQIRLPNDAQNLSSLTVSFALDLFALSINYFVKEK